MAVQVNEYENLAQWASCFAANKKTTTYCNITLSEDTFQAFVYAVKNHYWYQMYIDDLPIWGNTCSCLLEN